MRLLKKYLIYISWIGITGFLLFLSLGYYDSDSSILAQVEPQKFAISYQKAVRVKEIFVIPGQHVKAGDRLVRVERQDLLLDADRKTNQINNLKDRIEVLKIERASKLSLEELAFRQKMGEIDADLKRTNLLLSNSEDISENLKSLNMWSDSVSNGDLEYIKMRIDLLETEKNSVQKSYNLRLSEIEKVFLIQLEGLQKEIEYVRLEAELLKQEEKELIKYAHQDGTIGNVYVEKEELVSPYTVLVSLYEKNPTIIKALMHENQNSRLKIGDEVIVESTNRKYKVTGEVMEIGSRIVEYPERLKRYQEIQVYGRELFIKIPEKSEFLNGEKVFVRID